MRPHRALELYRRILRILPREFRDRYGEEMAQAFAASLELSQTKSVSLTLARAAVDTALLALRLRRPRLPQLRAVGLGTDARVAMRRLGRSPAVTVASVATLALGLGATLAMLTVVDAVLLRPLPYAAPERLVALFLHERAHDARRSPTSPVNFHAWRDESETLEHVSAAHPWSPSSTGGERPDELHGLRVSPGLFRLLGVPALLGRTLDDRDDGPDGERVLVLGYELYRDRFGLDTGVLGRLLTLDGETYRIVGVMPEGFRFPPFWAVEARFWAPLRFTPESAASHSRYLRVFARLRDGTSFDQATAEMAALGAQLESRFPEANAATAITIEPLLEPVVAGARPVLLLLLAAVVLLALTATANVANLQLAREAGRSRELALETALGAGRARVMRERLTESFFLSLAGGLAGSGIATALVPALVALAPSGVPRLAEIQVQRQLVLLGMAFSLLVTLALSLLTTPRRARESVASALRDGSARAGDGRGKRLRHTLIVWQLASSVVLLVAAGLVVRSFVELQRVDPGFRRDRLHTASLLLAGTPHAPAERQTVLFREIVEAVTAVPGVWSAALVNHLPIGGDSWGVTFDLEGRAGNDRELPRASQRTVTPGYFSTMAVPVLAGRTFSTGDNEDGQRVVVVNETFASRYSSLDDIVGRRIRIGHPAADDWRVVAGVVADTKQWDLTQDVDPEIYFPYAQNPASSFLTTTLVVASDLPAASVWPQVERAVWNVAGEIPIANARAIEQILAEHVAPERFAAALFGVFAALALLLSAVGLYGVLSYGVSRDTAELGLRAALGATRADLGWLVLVRGVRLVVTGLSLGLVGALLLGRIASGLIFGVRPDDPWTLLAACSFLAAIGGVAMALPARRAARLDPLEALRR